MTVISASLPAPVPTASAGAPTEEAESTVLARTESEAGTLVSSSIGVSGAKLDQDQDRKEYEGGGSMDDVLTRMSPLSLCLSLNRARIQHGPC